DDVEIRVPGEPEDGVDARLGDRPGDDLVALHGSSSSGVRGRLEDPARRPDAVSEAKEVNALRHGAERRAVMSPGRSVSCQYRLKPLGRLPRPLRARTT